MNCLPPKSGLLKVEKGSNGFLEIVWKDKNETSYMQSFNDQPSYITIDSDGKLYSKEWNGCRYHLKDKPNKPCRIFYDVDGQVRNMVFWPPEPKKLEDVHADYRNDWVRIYGNETQTL